MTILGSGRNNFTTSRIRQKPTKPMITFLTARLILAFPSASSSSSVISRTGLRCWGCCTVSLSCFVGFDILMIFSLILRQSCSRFRLRLALGPLGAALHTKLCIFRELSSTVWAEHIFQPFFLILLLRNQRSRIFFRINSNPQIYMVIIPYPHRIPVIIRRELVDSQIPMA